MNPNQFEGEEDEETCSENSDSAVSFTVKPDENNPTAAVDSQTLFDCKVCSKLFDNVHRLQRHMLCHDSSPELRKFKCGFCDKAFKFKHHLKVRNCSC
jgi:uncharacterized Zn-finger protein